MGARGPKTVDPTPQEIKRWTLEIRKGWSERTHRLRAGWTVDAADKLGQWTPPVVSLPELGLDERDVDDYPFWRN